MNSRTKGKVGEREFAELCREHGHSDVRRSVQYAGRVEDSADLVGLPGVHVEVKRVERLNIEDAMAQAVRDSGSGSPPRIPIVAHRKNRGKWMVTMLADDWFAYYSKVKT
jgi:Holliday junction resolvase